MEQVEPAKRSPDAQPPTHLGECDDTSRRRCLELGEAYYLGRGVPRDRKHAIELLNEATKGEDPDLAVDIARFLEREQIDSQMVVWLRAAACQDGRSDICRRYFSTFERACLDHAKWDADEQSKICVFVVDHIGNYDSREYRSPTFKYLDQGCKLGDNTACALARRGREQIREDRERPAERAKKLNKLLDAMDSNGDLHGEGTIEIDP